MLFVVATGQTSTLNLDADDYQCITRELCRNIVSAMQGASQRNQFLQQWDDQLKARYVAMASKRWRNSSDINDPLTKEIFLTVLPMLMQAVRRDPKIMVEAHQPANDDNARMLEDWLNAMSLKYRLNEHLYDVAYNACRDPVGLMYAGWTQHLAQVEKTRYQVRGKIKSFPIPAEERDEGEDYDEVHVLEPEVQREGCDFRAVELCDFYLYPADAISINEHEPGGAIGVGERIWLTENQLLDGIEDFGYDEEAVKDLIRSGPMMFASTAEDNRDRKNEYMGVSSYGDGSQDGYWECFNYYQRLPKLKDSNMEMTTPEEYQRRDSLCVCCPSRDIVLKLTLSPYAQRPYIPFYILPEPNMFLGMGICQMLEQLQEEATSALRQDIDSSDLRTSPVLVCHDDEWEEVRKQGPVGPGTVLAEQNPGSIRALQWSNPYQPNFQRSEYMRSRAQANVTAQGYGVMQPKVRKAAEVDATIGAADAKFELFLSNFQEGLSDLFAWIAALHMQFGSKEYTFRDRMGKEARITQSMMEGDYAFIPAATSTTANPDQRYKLAALKTATQVQYLGQILQAPPQFGPLIWHAYRAMYIDLGERQPESYIGPEPVPPPPVPQGTVSIPAMLQALQTAGIDPKVIPTVLANLQQSQGQGLNMAQAASPVLNPGAPPGGIP